MLKRLAIVSCVLACATTSFAQVPKPATSAAPAKAETRAEAKAEPAAKAAPEPPALPINIKIEVSITDQSGTNPPARKVVTMIASDRQSTSVRSSANVLVRQGAPPAPGSVAIPAQYANRNVVINVDARPIIVVKEPNKVSLNFGLEYLPKTGSEGETEPGMTSWNERLSAILESGKPMVVSQAADPTSDRKITVEVTATILK